MNYTNKTNSLSFITTCFNDIDQLKETYFKNVKTYETNNNIEFILINFCENEDSNITEYLTTNLYNEIKTGKVKYFRRNELIDELNISSLKNIGFKLANGKYVYNLDCDNYLDGNEHVNLEKSIGLYGENIVIHQNDGPSQILHSMWKDFNLCNNCHNDDLIWNKTTSRICLNKKIIIEIGGYNENEIYNKIDSNINLLLRLINSNIKYIHINLSFQNSSFENKFNKIYNFNMDLAIKNIYPNKNKKFTFKETLNDYILFDISEFKILTCFTVLYKCDDFIDNLLNDILSQTIFNNINFILINLPYTNNDNTNNKINELNKYKNIKIIDESYDYGLYNMWNKCVKMSETSLVSNMNPDDVRGSNWAYWQIINFEPNVALVTPKYTPIKKLVNYRVLAVTKPLIIWFNSKFNIDDNNNVIIQPINSYFTSKDMFQYNINYCFQSNNICNCSPIWRKNIIHNEDNYFDQDKYGCYADFVVWLNAGSKEYLYKQTNYLVGFYINENQLHRRLINDLNILKELIIKYEPRIIEYQSKNINKIPAEYVINKNELITTDNISTEYVINKNKLTRTNKSKNVGFSEIIKNTNIITEKYLIDNCETVLSEYSIKCSKIIKNICTMSTEKNVIELELFLLSLNLHYCYDVFVICDNFTNNWIDNNKNKFYNINIFALNSLDKYTTISSNDQQHVSEKDKWLDFMLEKTTIIEYVLNNSNDGVLFLDSDIVILNELPLIPDKDVVLSIHNIGIDSHTKYGIFNGGCLYVNNKKFPKWWKTKTYELKNIVYMEQGTLAHINNDFEFGVFTDQFNFGYWRYGLGNDTTDVFQRKHNLSYNNDNLLYKDNNLLSIHTHFFTQCKFEHELNILLPFNKLILELLEKTTNIKLNIIKDFIKNNQEKILDTKILDLYKKNIINDKKIIFLCDNGLTNRIMALINAIIFSKLYGTVINIYWPSNNSCYATFFDIFKVYPNINVITDHEFELFVNNNDINFLSTKELNQLSIDLSNINKLKFISIKEDESYNNVINYINNKDTNIYLISFVYLSKWSLDNINLVCEIYNNLKFTDNIQNRIDNFVNLNNINSSVYGIHIRMTDFSYVTNNLNIVEKIKNSISKTLITNPEQKFYLASDNNDIKIEFKNIFEDNIIYMDCIQIDKYIKNEYTWGTKYEANNVSRTKEACIDGFIEFNILNKTLFKYPNGASTYSILIHIMQRNIFDYRCVEWFNIDYANIERHIDFKKQ